LPGIWTPSFGILAHFTILLRSPVQLTHHTTGVGNAVGDFKNRSDLVLRPNRLSDRQIARLDRSSD